MKISSEWLQEFVALPSDEELENTFEMAGIGVEDHEAGQWTLEVTSNRGDWLCAHGLAREIGAMRSVPVHLPPWRGDEGVAPSGIGVDIENPTDCSRYVARIIENIGEAESPDWMQQRLKAGGMRPISLIVDVTNYVMLETGQPLHAFDAGKITGGQIIVRRARAGESLTTLDGVERALSPNVLVIADAKKPVALAGIMGGLDSEVSSGTTRVLLEAAHFAPQVVRRGARQVGLATEASRRFERWVDPNAPLRASLRAARLLQELGGATFSGALDRYPAPAEAREVVLRPSRANAVLGLHLPSDTMAALLRRLQLDVRQDGDTLRVRPPSFRHDIEREEDLIEEVARIHGYAHIPTTLSRGANSSAGRSLSQRLEERAKSALLRCGLTEVVTLTLSNENAMDKAGVPLEASGPQPVRLRNPLSEDFTLLRTSLAPSLLDVLQKNARHQGASPVGVFELGKVYESRGEVQPRERRMLGLTLLDTPPAAHWSKPEQRADFFKLKAIVEQMLSEVGAPSADYQAAPLPPFHPGRCASLSVDGQDLGCLGEVHPAVRERHDLPERAFLALLDFDALVRHITLRRGYLALPRFPEATRDLALVLPSDVPADTLLATLREAGGAHLSRLDVFDIYTGSPIPEGHKSIGLALAFRTSDRTLTDDEVEAALALMRRAAEEGLGAQLRG